MPFPYVLRRYYITALHKFQICQPHFYYLYYLCVKFSFLGSSIFSFALLKPKNAVFSLFRSSTDRNCLYSSISLSLFGDNSMKEDLRILSSCELFQHNYYCEHPVFLNFVENITSHKVNLLSFWFH